MTERIPSGQDPSSKRELSNNIPSKPLKLDPNIEWAFFDNDGIEASESEHEGDGDPVTDHDEIISNPNSSTSWGYKKLVRLVKKAKGAASRPVIAFIKKHLQGTKLILVMGQSGTGKTTMLKELTGLDLHIGDTMASGTLQYHVCPAVIDGEQYIFVDTAGFGAADLNNMANFHDIMSCLSILGPFVTIVGVLYVYGPPNQRISVEDQRAVRWIQCFCGPEFFGNVTFVTSHWDQYSADGFEDAWRRLEHLEQAEDVRRILNPPGHYHAGSTYHHGLPGGQGTIESYRDVLSYKRQPGERGDELRNLIRRQYAEVEPARLQIVREMEQGVPILETQAAKVLSSDLDQTAVRILDDRAVLVSSSEQKIPSATQGSSAPVHEEKTEPQNSNTEPKLLKDSGAAKAEQTKPKEERSWFQKLMWWFRVASAAASYFKEAREAEHESSNRPGSKPGPAWNLWDAVKNWWSDSY
ncbi:hypothetical protein jhhlp_008456 [Lomentospora prolificans]|uniref:G domain-containing protein n=1 Tax=Lomentospora prolificans TaxID=41688 RepID=A0A2N3MY29_9PEZI|nr:hypothetical protein jhhlp_008456 [Lomentospora prolificans]